MLMRQINQQNKRALQVSITPKGEEALAQWNAHCLEIETKSLEGFSEEEKKQFIAYLSRMYTNLTGKHFE